MPQRGTVVLACWCLSTIRLLVKRHRIRKHCSISTVTSPAAHRDASIRCLTTTVQMLRRPASPNQATSSGKQGPWMILRLEKALTLHVNVARPVQAPRQPQTQLATVYGPQHDTLDVAQPEWKHPRRLHVLTWLCVPLSLRDRLDYYSRGVPTDAQPMPIPALVVLCDIVPPLLVTICLNGQICNVEAPRIPSTVLRIPTPSRQTSSSAILLVHLNAGGTALRFLLGVFA
ncbi:unnamed protein product [Fusarium venenatum]|uniref:Uncharacterized protein n=1 Tax=Fusarium venenatum TaxID=56646 RepID=A0A2L2TSB3_9HYPO|nr:uncharacterized protein FVRRES_07191 [Fusarium venenatum]CEI62755.1 unnamed protein product [Fusarium venenatum]